MTTAFSFSTPLVAMTVNSVASKDSLGVPEMTPVCWSIRRLACSGLGTGTSPDVLNIYRNGTGQPAIWQLNGNNWGYSFGPTEMLLLPGEQLVAASVGSTPDAIYKELTSNLVPNAHMVAAGVIAVTRAQEYGYTVLSAG